MEKVKEFLVKALAWLKLAWAKVKSVARKVLRFLKKWWAHIINLIVVAVAYDFYEDSLLVGGWLFILLVYYLFWKILRAETLFEKDE